MSDELLELYADQHELTGHDAEREASDRDEDAAEALRFDCESLPRGSARIIIYCYPPAEVFA
jgi:hypothetical protein